jgi:D-lactate dehydrogenase
MNVLVFSTKRFDRQLLKPRATEAGLDVRFLDTRLSKETAKLAEGYRCVAVFVNDVCDRDVVRALCDAGVELIVTRSAGFNHIDLDAAAACDILVLRVPAYSPNAVAEHAMGIVLALNRKIHRAYNRVRDGNFAIDGLMGFDLHEKTVGVVGTGKIGLNFARIARGFGCRVLGYDPYPTDEFNDVGEYCELERLLCDSRVISLHCPLTPDTQHLIDEDAIDAMCDQVMLVNTSRGALVDTVAVIDGLKSGKIGSLGMDVYEEESDFFFRDLSERVIQDDVLARLLTFPNVLITSHQGFFTQEAVEAIADITIKNIVSVRDGGPDAAPQENVVHAKKHAGA